jgi:hypothetical protein
MSAVVGTRASFHSSDGRTSWISLNFDDLRETPDAADSAATYGRGGAQRAMHAKEEEMTRRLTLFVAALLAAATAALTFPPSMASDAGPARADLREQAVRVHR